MCLLGQLSSISYVRGGVYEIRLTHSLTHPSTYPHSGTVMKMVNRNRNESSNELIRRSWAYNGYMHASSLECSLSALRPGPWRTYMYNGSTRALFCRQVRLLSKLCWGEGTPKEVFPKSARQLTRKDQLSVRDGPRAPLSGVARMRR